ncbi:hypothetical protein JTY60_01210 [symbiont of Argiope bruennichi]|uniref:hypothetical protein n=1 Tax=symbiont of Argiope bruennichi TaxID=2810479 RepID=UPI003DA24C7F
MNLKTFKLKNFFYIIFFCFFITGIFISKIFIVEIGSERILNYYKNKYNGVIKENKNFFNEQYFNGDFFKINKLFLFNAIYIYNIDYALEVKSNPGAINELEQNFCNQMEDLTRLFLMDISFYKFIDGKYLLNFFFNCLQIKNTPENKIKLSGVFETLEKKWKYSQDPDIVPSDYFNFNKNSYFDYILFQVIEIGI